MAVNICGLVYVDKIGQCTAKETLIILECFWGNSQHIEGNVDAI